MYKVSAEWGPEKMVFKMEGLFDKGKMKIDVQDVNKGKLRPSVRGEMTGGGAGRGGMEGPSFEPLKGLQVWIRWSMDVVENNALGMEASATGKLCRHASLTASGVLFGLEEVARYAVLGSVLLVGCLNG
jgi:hypothetical protein